MAIRAIKNEEGFMEDHTPTQLELVKLPVEEIQREISNITAEIELLTLKQKKARAEAKRYADEAKEKFERAKHLSRQVCSPHLRDKIEMLEANFDDEGECGDLDGRVMDQSNIKKPSAFLQGLEDSLTDAEESADNDEEE